jgi:hypothetical protein
MEHFPRKHVFSRDGTGTGGQKSRPVPSMMSISISKIFSSKINQFHILKTSSQKRLWAPDKMFH